MLRSLASLASISLLLAASNAQCFEQSFGVLAPIAAGAAGYGDDVLFDLQPMNITFPMGGLATSYTHAHICSNGVIYLTNGATSTGTTYAYQTTAFFVGAAGQDPRIAPLWIDLDSVATNGGVYFNNTIPGKFVVTWSNIVEWATQGPTFTLQAQLFANGDVTFYYSSSVYGISVGYGSQFVSRSGITEANGVIDPGSVDLSVGGNSNLASFAMYEEFPLNVFDLQDRSVTFLNVGTGYVQTVSACAPAVHESYGTGCYSISDSFYQYHPDASTAPTFSGQSMTMTPAGNSYLVAWGGGSFVVPVLATSLTLSDDGEVAQTPSVPFPTAAGPVSPLYIGANGLISIAANSTSASYTPDPNGFLNSPVTAFYSWHDFNPTEPGSGPVHNHEGIVLGETIAYVTWNGVENYPTAVVNPSTLQMQLNLTTGVVKFVWQTMDGDTTSPFGSAHVMGWSPGGPSTDGGSLTLATTSPFVVQSPNIFTMNLSASPAPISSPTLGTVVTYTTTNMREYAAGSGVYIGMNILSLTQVPLGLDLGFLGAPGCSAYVGGLDFTQAMVGLTPTNSVSITLPTNLPVGTQIFAQSIGLITPNSMPNGQNAFGLLVSNGLRSFLSTF